MSGEEVVAPEPVAAAAPVLGEPMDVMTALQLVLKKSLAHDGLVKGLHEAAMVIEKHAAQLCVLAEDCDQPDYVSLISVPSAKTIGEWVGLCKIDSEGKARKENKAILRRRWKISCCISELGYDIQAIDVAQVMQDLGSGSSNKGNTRNQKPKLCCSICTQLMRDETSTQFAKRHLKQICCSDN